LAELEGFVYEDPALLIVAPEIADPWFIRSGYKFQDIHFEQVYEVSDATGLYQVERLARACIQCEKLFEGGSGMFLGSSGEDPPQEEPVAVLLKLDFGHIVLRRYRKRGSNFVHLVFSFRATAEWSSQSLSVGRSFAAPPASVIEFGRKLLEECQEAEALWESA
jgi:hypothetical protein